MAACLRSVGSAMARMVAAMAGLVDPVVDGLELLVDEQGQEVAAPDLAVEHLPDRGEGAVGDAREAGQVHEDDVQVLQRLAQQGEARLRRGLPHELLDVRIDHVVLLEVALHVLVEAGQVDLVLGEDRGAELDRAQDDVVDQPELLRPVPEGQLLGLLLGQGLVLDAEEPLEAAEPHLQLEQVAGLARGHDVVHPLAELAAQEVRGELALGGSFIISDVGHWRGLY